MNKRKRKSKRGNYEIEDLGDVQLPPDLDARVQQLTEAADLEQSRRSAQALAVSVIVFDAE